MIFGLILEEKFRLTLEFKKNVLENIIQSFLKPIQSFFGGYPVYNYLKPKRVRLKENSIFSHS